MNTNWNRVASTATLAATGSFAYSAWVLRGHHIDNRKNIQALRQELAKHLKVGCAEIRGKEWTKRFLHLSSQLHAQEDYTARYSVMYQILHPPPDVEWFMKRE